MSNPFVAMGREEAEGFMAEPRPLELYAWFAEMAGQTTVLDVGCGKAPYVMQLYRSDLYTGLDCSLELLRIAMRDNPSYCFMWGDGRVIPWPDNSVGAVLIKGVLEHIETLEDALMVYDEALRVAPHVLVGWHMIPHDGPTQLEKVDAADMTQPLPQNRYERAAFDRDGLTIGRYRVGTYEMWSCRRG